MSEPRAGNHEQVSVNKPPRLEQFRPYLMLLARAHLGPHQRSRVDASDIVQFTLLDAHEKLDQFRGSSSEEMAGWLRRMLSFNIADAFRALATRKRNVQLEQPVESAFDESCSKLSAWLEAIETSPSGRASRNETLMLLAAALSRLPDAQREAIELHHLDGLTLAETAQVMGRSAAAIIGLLRRGLSQLRDQMRESPP